MIEDDIERVRKRPGMYAGDTDSGEGLHNLAQEIIYNAVNEALAGHGKKIEIRLRADGSCSVHDEGRGIPVEAHPRYADPIPQVIMTKLYGRPIHTNIKRKMGFIGAVVVNALSEWFEPRIWRNRIEWFMRFENGKVTVPLKTVGRAPRRGMDVTFLPSGDVFLKRKFDFDVLNDRLQKISVVNSDICLTLIDERGAQPKSATYSV